VPGIKKFGNEASVLQKLVVLPVGLFIW